MHCAGEVDIMSQDMKSETTALMVRPKDEIVAPTSEVAAPLDIRSRILTIRGVQVMLDRDIAELYQVPTKRLNEQVKRNNERFPERFMFQLSDADMDSLRSQFATSNSGLQISSSLPESLRSQFAASKRGGVRYRPYVFTEYGITMLASVLNSPIAIAASVRIIDTFVAMRKALASMAPLLSRIESVERRQLRIEDVQGENESRFKEIFDAMRSKDFPSQKIFFENAPKKRCFEGKPRRRSRAHEPRMWRSGRKEPRASMKDAGKKKFAVIKTQLTPEAVLPLTPLK